MVKILLYGLFVGFVLINDGSFMPQKTHPAFAQPFAGQMPSPIFSSTDSSHEATVAPTPVSGLTRPVGQPGKWQLHFAANFDGNRLNEKKWVTCFWWDNQGCTIATNHELEWYQRGNVTVGNGILRLQARKEAVTAPNGHRFTYTSGMISSGQLLDALTGSPKFAFQYGYVEIRAKVPRGKGLWTALWLLPIDHESRPEIDVVEVLGHQPGAVKMHVHYDQANGQEKSVGENWTGSDLSTDWHVFAVDWQPTKLIWYVDGVERWRFSERAYIPAEPMYILANLAVGGDWPGTPDAKTPFPSDLWIDYIRVWER